MDPLEDQIFTGSGTYIMNGALLDEHEPWPQANIYRFTLLHLRLSSSGDGPGMTSLTQRL